MNSDEAKRFEAESANISEYAKLDSELTKNSPFSCISQIQQISIHKYSRRT